MKAPNIEPYYRSLIDTFKDPFKGNPILIMKVPTAEVNATEAKARISAEALGCCKGRLFG